ncbi:heat-shock protein Hsp20 [Cohnella xylanilytica]|uniref:Hsp20/alpha crystallin family protein n=1 Tax=Paenibacillaceae TaxID=186822 RepID=UPI001577464D|nr:MULTISPECIES: Hsp20/alpha crystallin family protein [Paenibacillaceae]NTZ16081.1 Hsp20/alpha crystallin family protein [Paenibacillus sp. JMULE4]GIO14401.1 heat-shock protein Hsp20 [Cohnella xylanilytica]
MPLIPWDSFRNTDLWRRDLEKIFNEGLPEIGARLGFATPRIDVFENEHEVIASCEIPGLDKKEDLHIDVDENMLTISGTIKQANEVKQEQIHRKERFVGRFQRSVSLPSRVQTEGTTATYRNGVLEVRMPKLKADTQRQIDVQFH